MVKIEIRALFLIFVSSTATFESNEAGELPEYATFCPHNDFCASTASRSANMSISCCQRCSCHKSCFAFGSCCPDIGDITVEQNTSEYIEVHYKCAYPQQVLDSARNVSAVYSEFKYRVVDSCPNATISQRFPGCLTPLALRDFVFVSDPSNGNIVYKNEQCAACHGANETVDWLLYVTNCGEHPALAYDSAPNIDTFVLENCRLYTWPPLSHDVSQARCPTEAKLYDRCNATERWTKYNRKIEEACMKERSLQNTIFEDPRGYIYANVYCYLCNNEDQYQPVNQVCKRPSLDISRGLSIKLTALIDFSKTSVVETDQRCLSNHVWDKFVKKCRPLHCMLGEKSISGKCISPTTLLYGYAVDSFFELQTKRNYFPVQLGEGWIELKQHILQQINSLCGSCVTKLYQKTNGTTFYLHTELYTNENCSIKQILQYIGELYNNGSVERTVTYHGTDYDFVIKAVLTAPPDLTTFQVVNYNRKHCHKTLPLKLHYLLLCPKFVMPKTEFIALGLNHTTDMKTDMNITFDEVTDTVAICMDAYFMYMENASTRNALWSGYYITSILAAISVNQYRNF